MADTQADAVTADNETVEAGESTSAETQNTDTTDTPGPVPYDRFSEVNEAKKLAESRASEQALLIEELRANQSAAVPEPEPTTTVSSDLPEAPAGLNTRQQADWLIRNTNERWFKEKFNMTPEQASAALSSIPETSRTAQEIRWQRIAEANNLDANDKEVQSLVSGLISGAKMTPEAAAKRVAEIKNVGKQVTKEPPNMETGGVTGQLTVKDARSWDADTASELAAKGQRMPELSLKQVFEESDKRRSKK